MPAYLDESREALAGILRPGNAGPNIVADRTTVRDLALAQIPVEQIEDIEILLCADSAGATHELIDWRREASIRFSVVCDLTEPVRQAILKLPQTLGLRRIVFVGQCAQDGRRLTRPHLAAAAAAVPYAARRRVRRVQGVDSSRVSSRCRARRPR